jgi:archaellum biogenesis ATPase FlaH
MGLETKIANVSPGSIVILEFPAEANQVKLAAEFLKFKEKTRSRGVYVSSNRPTNNLIEKVKDYGYDLKKALVEDRVKVVDLVSKSGGDDEVSGVIYISSASELSTTQMAIEKAINQIRDKDGSFWFLLDSIATPLVFNPPESLLEFLHFLISRLRILRVDGIIFTVSEGIPRNVISTIRQFCDVIIKI